MSRPSGFAACGLALKHQSAKPQAAKMDGVSYDWVGVESIACPSPVERFVQQFKTVRTGLVYRNPIPHLCSLHAYYPTVVRCGDGSLLASFMLASAMEAIDGRVVLSRSDDGGATWSTPTPAHEKSPGHCETGKITYLGDGRVVLLLSESERPDPAVGSVNPENLGHVPTRLSLLRSHDNGQSWSTPQVIEPPLVGPTFELCTAIMVLPDGRWLLPTSTWRGWDGESPNGMKAVAFVSDDMGETWSSYVEVMDGTDRGVLFWEQKIVALGDGRLFALSWAHVEADRSDLANHAAVADGKTLKFSSAVPTPLRGQTPALLACGVDEVLCVYRRTDEPGLWAAMLRVGEGAQVEVMSQRCLWRPMLPPKHDPAEGLVEEFRGLKFGAPCLLRLNGQEVCCAFWCVENGVANIRWITLRL